MRIELQRGNLRLARGQTLRVLDGAGSTVCCHAGNLWLTEENRPRDIVLGPGACHTLSQHGTALIQSLGEADVAIA